MNKKGQSLIIFVLILPIIILFIAYVLSYSLVNMENNKIERIIKDKLIITVNKEIKDIEKIKNIIKENDKDINVLVDINDDTIKITVNKKIKNIFKNVFIINDIKKCYLGNYSTKEINNCE